MLDFFFWGGGVKNARNLAHRKGPPTQQIRNKASSCHNC